MTDQLSRITALNGRCRHGLEQNARVVINAMCLGAVAAGGRLVCDALARADVLAAICRYDFTPA